MRWDGLVGDTVETLLPLRRAIAPNTGVWQSIDRRPGVTGIDAFIMPGREVCFRNDGQRV